MSLLARISERARTGHTRSASRRILSLNVPALSSDQVVPALIHNLSEHGLRIETEAALRIDEVIRVDLPEAGRIDARVIWIGESFVGCRFLVPVSKAAVSAALLRSPARRSTPTESVRAELPLIGIVQRPTEIERFELGYETSESPTVAMMIALLVGLVVTASFVAALLRMAGPNLTLPLVRLSPATPPLIGFQIGERSG